MNLQGFYPHPDNPTFRYHDIRVCGEQVFTVKADITYNAKPVGYDTKLIGIIEMSIDVHLLNRRIRSSMGRHRTVGGFIRVIRIIQTFCFFKALSCLVSGLGIIFLDPGFDSGGSKRSIEALEVSMFWRIGSVRSTR